jgi:hypothetical protein
MNEPSDDSRTLRDPGGPEMRGDDNVGQMRTRFWLWLLALFVVVFCFELYKAIAFANGPAGYSTDYLAVALGGTLAAILISGILPMLWFGILRKFEYGRAGGPLALWCILAAIVCLNGYSVARFNHCISSRPVEECLSR